MSLRVYLISLAVSWLSGFSSFVLITHTRWLLATLILFVYLSIVLRIAIEMETDDEFPPYRFVGSHDKPRKELE